MRCLMKVADFGLARSLKDEPDKTSEEEHVMTDYVATRWYRAPEILMGCPSYSFGVDMWGLGCILGEILKGKPIFPGNSTLDQLHKIMNLAGRPDDKTLEGLSQYAVSMVEQLNDKLNEKDMGVDESKTLHGATQVTRRRWETEFPGTAEPMVDARDLLYQLLHVDPARRISAVEALEHPYVKQFHDVTVERTALKPVEICIEDTRKLSTNQYRSRLYQEVIREKQRSHRMNVQEDPLRTEGARPAPRAD